MLSECEQHLNGTVKIQIVAEPEQLVVNLMDQIFVLIFAVNHLVGE